MTFEHGTICVSTWFILGSSVEFSGSFARSAVALPRSLFNCSRLRVLMSGNSEVGAIEQRLAGNSEVGCLE